MLWMPKKFKIVSDDDVIRYTLSYNTYTFDVITRVIIYTIVVYFIRGLDFINTPKFV